MKSNLILTTPLVWRADRDRDLYRDRDREDGCALKLCGPGNTWYGSVRAFATDSGYFAFCAVHSRAPSKRFVERMTFAEAAEDLFDFLMQESPKDFCKMPSDAELQTS